MADPLKIDCHMHIYPTKADGRWDKSNYQIWEYGERSPAPSFSSYDGDLDDALEAMEKAGYAHAVMVNLFQPGMERSHAVAALPEDLTGADRERDIAAIEASMGERLKAFNRWACEAVAGRPITPYLGIDPGLLTPEENVAHLREMVENHGARGIKLHPVSQRFAADDPRMHPVYATCVELGAVVLSHTGPARTGEPLGEPKAFANVMRAFPNLKLVMAHSGGATWQQCTEFAREFPQVAFDVCEIIAWLGASKAPTPEQFAGMIREIGAERFLMGTDFPWYDLDTTFEQLMELPLLSREEKEGIAGANAARFMGLSV
jgi:predicted TIM-barrel fold metal-dependent hydrolase